MKRTVVGAMVASVALIDISYAQDPPLPSVVAIEAVWMKPMQVALDEFSKTKRPLACYRILSDAH